MTAKKQPFVIFGDEPTISIPWWLHAAPASGSLMSRQECIDYFRRCIGVLPYEMVDLLLEAAMAECMERDANEKAGNEETSQYAPALVFLPQQGNSMSN